MGPIAGAMLEVRFGHQAAFVALAAFAGVLLVAAAAGLPETNPHRNPTATRPRRLLTNYAHVLRSREFSAFALLGIASYGGLFAFIAGSSFVLIRVLGVPTAWFGVVYAAIIVGYLAGTLWCPRLLARGGLRRAVTTGTALAAIGGTAMLALALADIRHPAAVAIPQFLYMVSHGINFPCAMAGTVAPFPRHAGAAAGMFGFLAMVVAALIGVAIGVAPDDTVVPMAAAIAGASLVSTLAVAFLIRPMLASHPRLEPPVAKGAEID
jgi:DHA1 family bicyclomycin/chloramphenicol resistance-like MFS transporter